ncbi:MAG: hypothetical protein IPP01_02075 [Saprospiraceae bacterium]|nr:hypothetical protein [Saprospiraceae bacterium]
MLKNCIIVPVYKSKLSPVEEISFKQLINVLGNYDIYVVTHTNVNCTEFQNMNPNLNFKYFESNYFESIKGYNQLCLSTEFYNAFKEYRYMLIAQLDTYIFKNEFNYWTEKNYDYIGAPWLKVNSKGHLFDLSRFLVDRVGNGGLSLRNIKTFIALSKKYKWLAKLFPKNEDFFWCIIIPLRINAHPLKTIRKLQILMNISI